MTSKPLKPAIDPWEGVYSGAIGLFLALTLIKLGHPVIMDDQIQPPGNREELTLGPWPMAFGYTMLFLVVGLSLRFWRWQTHVPVWWIATPLVWLGWQFISAFSTVSGSLTWATVPHFTACVALFFVGLFSFSRVTRLRPFWIGLIGGVVVVLTVGWWQHFGGLEETRRFLYSLPNWNTLPPEFLQKAASNRIYSTLFYPNALAGAVLLLLPVTTVITWSAGRNASHGVGWIGGSAMTVLGIGCLYWSGSKSGWLIAIIQILATICAIPLSARLKGILLAILVSAGLGGFSLKYAGYFEKGATSISARFDYWNASLLTIKEKNIFGSGPGTFMISYGRLKPPNAEMARLAHNDFLQQASDSGLVGGMAYFVWLLGGIILLYRNSSANPLKFSVWLGLLGIFLQGFVEFGLYIPAISWLTFLLFGWLAGVTNQFDKSAPRS